MEQTMVHVLVVCFPAQGHINPLLRLAKVLASKGLLVTFSTTDFMCHLMKEASDVSKSTAGVSIGKGRLRFDFFSDGWGVEEGIRYGGDIYRIMDQLHENGPKGLTDLIKRQNIPVSCVINNPFLPWATDVAVGLGIPSAILWVQSCSVFSIYYHYTRKTVPFPTKLEPSITVDLPGLPLLRPEEIPSFLHHNDHFKCLREVILGQLERIHKLSWILVESFDDLETETLKAMSKYVPLTPIGPLFKWVQEDKSEVSGDLFKSEDCIDWLDSQAPNSVVYVSFGSVVVLPKEQMIEMAHGLKDCGLKFLWVTKPRWNSDQTDLPEGYAEEIAGKGKIVLWSPQEKVLSHPSIACFLTHCGWNSTMESITSGVPLIVFPSFGDQKTNSKFIVDIYKMGVNLSENYNPDFTREDVKRSIFEVTKGDRAEEIKTNALNLKTAAAKAVAPGGSSDQNVNKFIDELKTLSATLKFETSTCKSVPLIHFKTSDACAADLCQ